MIEMTIDKKYAHQNQYYAKVVLLDGVFSDAIRIPGGDITRLVYYLKTIGTALIQATLAPADIIDAGLEEWIDIDADDEISPAVSAVRGKATGAAVVLELRCQ